MKILDEGAKKLALILVELISPDIMYNGIPWPEEEFIKVLFLLFHYDLLCIPKCEARSLLTYAKISLTSPVQ